ncbi:universal stress protein [Zunongwangia sp. H14]|uniref:universal stress protein n=1 Tax=Zunongwangia sp. H14 TaxID=3240792 RepID=UPI003564CD91
MKNILVATDFSKEAYCALHYATKLYKNEECTFFITNFYANEVEISVYSMLNEEEFKKLPGLQAASHSKCTEVIHQITRDNKQTAHFFKIITSNRKLVHALPEIILEMHIDLVVMGTRGHSGTMTGFMGSNTSRVIKKTIPCPLLVVPGQLPFKAPGKIAFATELKHKFSNDSLYELKKIAEKSNSGISILYVGEEGFLNEKQNENLNNLKLLLEGNDLEVTFISSDEEVSKAISTYVKQHGIQLLSMIYYAHKFSHTIFREPVIRKIDEHLSLPFLVLPQKKISIKASSQN